MTGIKSSVGLISGIDYTTLVDQLIALDGKQRDTLDARTKVLESQELALTNMTALFLTTSYMIANLNKAETWNRTTITSSNAAVLTATRNGTPVEGSYTFTAIQMAQAQQTIAQGVVSDTQALGKTGTITIGNGRTLANDIALQELNGGEGVPKGYIRITDGSGTRATVDLRNAVTMNDVIETINNTTTIDVIASLDGDKLIITDQSGGDKTLTIAEVSGGRTAEALGILGKADEDGVLTGVGKYFLGTSTKLNSLNDGNGLALDGILPDMTFTCRDGSTVSIDFKYKATTAEIEAGAPENHVEVTLGDLIDTINNSKDANGVAGKITAFIADDGKSLIFADNTSGTNKTTITQSSSNPVLQSLGLINGKFDMSDPVTSDTGVFRTRQLIGDLDSVLTSSLNGGSGISKAVAGDIEVQDRSGKTATLSFTQAELDSMQTLSATIKLFNEKLAAEDIGIKVEMNDQKTGLKLVDTTGSSSKNLIFRDKTSTVEIPGEDGADPTTKTVDPQIAKTFGLTVDQASGTVNGKGLGVQTVSYATNLSDLNGGKGITLAGGKIAFMDSAGKTAVLTIDSTKHKTVGDLINSINNLSTGVVAMISENGDGIMLQDVAGGTGNFACWDADTTSKTARDLKLVQVNSKADDSGRRIIDGTQTFQIQVEEKDTLDDIRKKINDLGGNFKASIISDGSSAPYRLMITGSTTGLRGAFNVDLSALGLDTTNMSEAQDAILAYGDGNKDGALILHSSSNTFKNAINGIDLTIKGTSTSPVTVSSEKTSTDIKASLKQFVENYNKYQEQFNVDTYSQVNTTTGKVEGNALANNRVAKSFGYEISKILSKRIYGIKGITSLQDIGISVRSNLQDTDGTNKESNKLTFDESVFDALYESNPEGLQEFFFKEQTLIGDDGKETTKKTGWAQSFGDVADMLTGSDSGVVFAELKKLGTQIDNNIERSDYLTARLEVKRAQMLKKFYAMEQAMAKMSSSMNAVSSIASSWNSNYSSTGS